MVRFDVSSLIEAQLGASLTFDVDVGPQSLTDGSTGASTEGAAEELSDALEVDFLCGTIRVTRVQEGLLVQGAVDSQLRMECVRCLEPFALPITLDLEETFRLPGASPNEDFPYAVGTDGWLDLTPLLREQGWLAIPMKPLCSPECKGLCPQCGTNLNLASCTCESTKIDPRLESLKELLN